MMTIYKWLTNSLIASLFYMNFSGLATSPEFSLRETRRLHPFHVSTTEIDHNAKDKILEVSCRIFTDDFEAVLEKNYKTKVDLTHPQDKAAIDKIVSDYIVKHLQIKADGKQTSLSYLGFEIDHDAVSVYSEVDNISMVKKIETSDNILYDQFDDQISIIHVVVNGNRKSLELNNPETQASFQF